MSASLIPLKSGQSYNHISLIEGERHSAMLLAAHCWHSIVSDPINIYLEFKEVCLIGFAEPPVLVQARCKAAFTARATCCPNEQHVAVNIYVGDNMLPGNKLLVWATCCLYLGNIITIHLCHGRLVSLCIQQQTDNKLATVLFPIQETIWRQHVAGPWCKRGLSSFHQRCKQHADGCMPKFEDTRMK